MLALQSCIINCSMNGCTVKWESSKKEIYDGTAGKIQKNSIVNITAGFSFVYFPMDAEKNSMVVSRSTDRLVTLCDYIYIYIYIYIEREREREKERNKIRQKAKLET